MHTFIQCQEEGDVRSLCLVLKIQADIVASSLGRFLSSLMSSQALALMSARTLDVAFNPGPQRWKAAMSWLITVPLASVPPPVWVLIFWFPLKWTRKAAAKAATVVIPASAGAPPSFNGGADTGINLPVVLLTAGFIFQYGATAVSVIDARGPHAEAYVWACLAIYVFLPFLGWSWKAGSHANSTARHHCSLDKAQIAAYRTLSRGLAASLALWHIGWAVTAVQSILASGGGLASLWVEELAVIGNPLVVLDHPELQGLHLILVDTLALVALCAAFTWVESPPHRRPSCTQMLVEGVAFGPGASLLWRLTDGVVAELEAVTMEGPNDEASIRCKSD